MSQVLLVDSDSKSRQSMLELLAKQGHRITLASTVEEGMEHFIHEVPTIVVTDLGVRSSGTGDTLVEQIRHYEQIGSVASTPIVVLSRKVDAADLALMQKHDVASYLQKPADPKKVRDIIRRLSQSMTGIAPSVPNESVLLVSDSADLASRIGKGISDSGKEVITAAPDDTLKMIARRSVGAIVLDSQIKYAKDKTVERLVDILHLSLPYIPIVLLGGEMESVFNMLNSKKISKMVSRAPDALPDVAMAVENALVFRNLYRTQLLKMGSARVYGIIGARGVGKTTIRDLALIASLNSKSVISSTDRTPRPGEIDGVDHYFLGNNFKTGDYDISYRFKGQSYGYRKSDFDSLLKLGYDVYFTMGCPEHVLKIRDDFFPTSMSLVMVTAEPSHIAQWRARRDGKSSDIDAINRELAAYRKLYDEVDVRIVNQPTPTKLNKHEMLLDRARQICLFAHQKRYSSEPYPIILAAHH